MTTLQLSPDDAITAVVEGLRRDLADPSYAWSIPIFDPWLARELARVNAEFLEGLAPSDTRCFWFDALFAEGVDAWCMVTGGFAFFDDELGPIVGVNSVYKTALEKATQVLRHEACHLIVGVPLGHGPEWRDALRCQNKNNESWVEDQLRAYSASETLLPRLLAFKQQSRARGRNGNLIELRAFLNRLEPEERIALIDGTKGNARLLLLRALAPGGAS